RVAARSEWASPERQRGEFCRWKFPTPTLKDRKAHLRSVMRQCTTDSWHVPSPPGLEHVRSSFHAPAVLCLRHAGRSTKPGRPAEPGGSFEHGPAERRWMTKPASPAPTCASKPGGGGVSNEPTSDDAGTPRDVARPPRRAVGRRIAPSGTSGGCRR